MMKMTVRIGRIGTCTPARRQAHVARPVHVPSLLPQLSPKLKPPFSQNDMDFSQLNAAEQAQMSRILEKKQVRFPNSIHFRFADRSSNRRCKTS